ncbi:MAG: hypothetical protein WBA39_11420 [Rivularia sp. (in: cyanobacteria)]
MDIYVESRTKQVDYYWVSQSTAPEKIHNVPSIIQSVNKFNGDKDLKLIHESDPSIVLLRSQGKLLLFVSGLRTKRQDKDRRYIRNSIAWIGEKADEPILRQIVALILKNNLRILENVVVESSNSSGEFFEVNWHDIEQLTPPNITATNDLPQENGSKIALFSEQRTQELASELIRYTLPERDGVLLAVTTGFKPKAIFVRANVWRGLSNDTSLSNVWVPVVPVPKHPTPTVTPEPNRNNKNLLITFIGGAVAAVVIGIFLIQQQQPSICLQAFPTFEFIKTEDVNKNVEVKIDSFKLPNKISIVYSEVDDANDQSKKIRKFPDVNDKSIQSIVKSLEEILIAANEKLEITAAENLADRLIFADGKIEYPTKLAIYKFQNKYSKKNITKTGNTVDVTTWQALEEMTGKDENAKQSWDNLKNEIWNDLIDKKNGNKADAKQELEKVCP